LPWRYVEYANKFMPLVRSSRARLSLGPASVGSIPAAATLRTALLPAGDSTVPAVQWWVTPVRQFSAMTSTAENQSQYHCRCSHRGNGGPEGSGVS
jgi:hypothetical protein